MCLYKCAVSITPSLQTVIVSPPSSVDPTDQKKTACYDIDVEVDDPLKGQMNSFLSSTTNQQEIAALEMKVRLHLHFTRVVEGEKNCILHLILKMGCWCLYSLQIHETIEYINQLKTERDFMLSFSNNPQEFIKDWLKSQSRDLKVDAMLQLLKCSYVLVYTTAKHVIV